MAVLDKRDRPFMVRLTKSEYRRLEELADTNNERTAVAARRLIQVGLPPLPAAEHRQMIAEARAEDRDEPSAGLDQ